METFWQKIINFFNLNGLKIVSVIAIIVLGIIAINIIKSAMGKIFKKRNVDKIVINFINSLMYIILIIIIVASIFDMLNISTTPFVTILGAVGLALSLSLQESLSNIASGMVIIITKPFKQEDYVKIGESEGYVKKINLLTTELYTFENRKITLPNNKLTKSDIINYTTLENSRVDFEFNVSYNTTIDKFKELINNVIDKNIKILKEPLPFIRLYKQAASSLVFVVKIWVKTPDYWTVYFDMQEQVYNAIKEAGIEIPYNKMDINILNGTAIKNNIKTINNDK